MYLTTVWHYTAKWGGKSKKQFNIHVYSLKCVIVHRTSKPTTYTNVHLNRSYKARMKLAFNVQLNRDKEYILIGIDVWELFLDEYYAIYV